MIKMWCSCASLMREGQETPYEPHIVPTTNTPHPNTNPPNIDLNEEWAEPTLEDDIASMDGFDDE